MASLNGRTPNLIDFETARAIASASHAYEIALPLEAFEEVQELRLALAELRITQIEHDDRFQQIVSRYGRLPLPGEMVYLVLARQARIIIPRKAG